MGNFICSVILLLSIIIFVGVNTYNITDLCDEILALIESGNTKTAIELWESKEKYLSLFVRDAETDLVNSQILSYRLYGENDSTNEQLIYAVTELKESEKISFLNVF